MIAQKSIMASSNMFKKEEEEQQQQHNHRGGIKTLPFILANEICDRFASLGFHANLISYLTKELHMPNVAASNILTNFGGVYNFTPLFGALIADSFTGPFWTIVVGSVIFELGLISLTISATLPSLRPPPCQTQEEYCKQATFSQLSIFYICLLLTAIGSGGIRPCVVPFAAAQFDMTKTGVAARKWNLFNCYYFSTGLAPICALTIVMFIQEKSWALGLGIPAIAMLISIIAFGIGAPLYKQVKAEGSPVIRLAQVIVAAVKKRKEVLPKDYSKLLYENKKIDAAISLQGRLLHTDQFKWLDKAAIAKDDEANDPNTPPNLWRLSTVHRVGELKSIIRVLPIWASGILLVAALSHNHSFVIQQARSMDRHLSPSFQIPPASISIFSVLTMMPGIILYERFIIPFVRRFTGNPSGITCLQRMAVGLLVNIIATVVAALVEIKRKKVAAKHHLLDKPDEIIPISVFWLVPQFVIHGVAEVFMSVGHLEFLYDQSPESMRSCATALFCVAIAIGSYVGTLLVTLVRRFSGKEGDNWLPNWNLNRGRLEYYFLLVSGIQVINLVYFVICAEFYTFKPLEENSKMNKEEDLEQGKEKILCYKLNGTEDDGEGKVTKDG